MVSVDYHARIVADADFIDWLIGKDKTQFLHLTHIKCSSNNAKGEHNTMLDFDFKTLLDSKKIQESNLRASFKEVKLNSLNIPTTITDPIDQRIIFAIALATKGHPLKTYIFTTNSNLLKYKSSPHYSGVKSIAVKSEEDALDIIKSFWLLFTSCREKSR